MNPQNLNIDKDNVFKFLKNLNTELVQIVDQMKADFQQNPSTNNIKDRFQTWKQQYSDVVTQQLQKYIFTPDTDEESFDFKEFLNKITEDYQNEPEFLDMLKVINTEIENLKDFIKSQLIKDPSIYFVKEI